MTGHKKIQGKRMSRTSSKVGRKYGQGASKRRLNSRDDRSRGYTGIII